LNKVKEFVVQDQSIYKDAKTLNKKPQVKRPGTAKVKGNVELRPEENVIEKVERERKEMKFPLKK